MNAQLFRQEAEEMFDHICALRRSLHQVPETGFDLEHTLAFVRRELRNMGLEPMECGRAGITVCLGGKQPGKVILLRADMDALPMREDSDVAYAAKNGKMHACGHDLHTAMLLGAARLLKTHEEEIQGTVKFMFQPAEETLEGARDMIEGGVLEQPQVDAALMIHVMAGMPLKSGMLIVSAPGVGAPAADYFEIHIQGKGCHGSMPHTGVDPLTAAAHILIALQEVHARELSMGDRAALTIGIMKAGTAANVIPDAVTMGGTIRAFGEETRALVKQRLTEIAQGIAKSFRASAAVVFGSGCPSLLNDEALSHDALHYGKELLGEEQVLSTAALGSGSSGSEDFACVSQRVSSLMLTLCAGHSEEGYPYPQHHPMVKFDESVLSLGSAVYAWMALRWLEEHGQR